ncbi:hypothetical protein [Ornithinimicrobium pekingense]|uniref:hypothetical protein n=1 Tax=Ornithinimicrobium pekingense TaxID=384677 RepID=UPI000410026B|nr:hypothetical protein [Ornithinimicrobium pekingense]
MTSAGAAAAASAVVGVVVGGLLWLAWEPTTRECGTISECFGAPVSAAMWTLGILVVALVARRVLQLRPVLGPTLSAFLGGSAVVVLIQGLGDIWPRQPHPPLTPWWSWVVVGGMFGALAHWAHQPGRSRVGRVVPVVVVLGLVTAGVTWISVERDHRQLVELEAVGVDTVTAPTFADFSVSYARGGVREGVGGVVRVNLSPHAGSSAAWPEAYLVPVRGRDLCELALQVVARGTAGCVETDGGVEVIDDYLLGAGARDGGTLLLVTARVSPTRDEPEEWTMESLRRAVDRRVATTLEELRDGDVD